LERLSVGCPQAAVNPNHTLTAEGELEQPLSDLASTHRPCSFTEFGDDSLSPRSDTGLSDSIH